MCVSDSCGLCSRNGSDRQCLACSAGKGASNKEGVDKARCRRRVSGSRLCRSHGMLCAQDEDGGGLDGEWVVAEILKVSIEEKAERKQGAPLGFRVSRPRHCLASRDACRVMVGSRLGAAWRKQGMSMAWSLRLGESAA